jgi:hypothetical protein
MVINLDWEVIAAVTSALIAILGFLYGFGFIKKPDKKDPLYIAIEENTKDHEDYDLIVENSKKEHKEFNECLKKLEVEIVKSNIKIDRLIKDCDKYITQQELTFLNDDFSKNLLSIEKRLEQMLEIIVSIKK